MTPALLLSISVLLLVCVFSSRLFSRIGVPSLLIFIVLGMLCGSDGLMGIEFENFDLAQQICSFGLIFILFYGGFGTNWKMARPIAKPAVLMSTVGVVVTFAVTGLLCHLVLGIPLLEGLLIGAVLSSTDAASVFSILRSKRLNLKNGLASLLEVESGSNDPVSYMLTLIVLTLKSGEGAGSLVQMAVLQIGVGCAAGFAVPWLAAYALRRFHYGNDGLRTIFVVAAALLSYSLSEACGGNGYLSVYITGIVLGNSRFHHKESLVHFFDGVTSLMQMVLFFALGLLSFPSRLPGVLPQSVFIALALLLVARPIASLCILSWFRIPLKQQVFVSWAGLRGAASIVFAIFTLTSRAALSVDLFHIVFFIALFSISLQGAVLPWLARKLHLVDSASPVLKTFNDYREEAATPLLELTLQAPHQWVEKTVAEADIPEDVLVVLVKRDGKAIVPNGSTLLLAGDTLVLSGDSANELEQLKEGGKIHAGADR